MGVWRVGLFKGSKSRYLNHSSDAGMIRGAQKSKKGGKNEKEKKEVCQMYKLYK